MMQAEFAQFTVKVNGVANEVTATALTDDVLTLTLTNKIVLEMLFLLNMHRLVAVKSQMPMPQTQIHTGLHGNINHEWFDSRSRRPNVVGQ